MLHLSVCNLFSVIGPWTVLKVCFHSFEIDMPNIKLNDIGLFG